MVSILAKFRAGRKVAQTQPSKLNEPQTSVPSAPYRHMPTHAMRDAMAGLPSSYRKTDRERIRDLHRRRSAMNPADGSSASTLFGGSSAGPLAESYPPMPLPMTIPSPNTDKTVAAQRARRRSERLENSIGRSPLHSVEISPHISGANSAASSHSSSASAHSAEDSLPKISEEGRPEATMHAPMPDNSFHVATVPVLALPHDPGQDAEEAHKNFWAAPRQLSSPPPDASAPAPGKTKRNWSLRRKARA
ncbi:MAG: hypothetical protein M1826_000300 [Phylliscum demangeonii]|nr:MAG: hypothetical protein M1826_000300 [Phylliscum demangeonii]